MITRRIRAPAGAWLADRFSAAVSEPVRLHVVAKRYLCAVDPAYHAVLSLASRNSLERQGGPMSAQEATRFALEPFMDAALRLRRWDDRGKVAGIEVPPLSDYRERMLGLKR